MITLTTAGQNAGYMDLSEGSFVLWYESDPAAQEARDLEARLNQIH